MMLIYHSGIEKSITLVGTRRFGLPERRPSQEATALEGGGFPAANVDSEG
jgi:hypothetical protein